MIPNETMRASFMLSCTPTAPARKWRVVWTSLTGSNATSTTRATTIHEVTEAQPKSSALDLLKASSSKLGFGPPQGAKLGAWPWTSSRCWARSSALDLLKVLSSKLIIGPRRGTSEVLLAWDLWGAKLRTPPWVKVWSGLLNRIDLLRAHLYYIHHYT